MNREVWEDCCTKLSWKQGTAGHVGIGVGQLQAEGTVSAGTPRQVRSPRMTRSGSHGQTAQGRGPLGLHSSHADTAGTGAQTQPALLVHGVLSTVGAERPQGQLAEKPHVILSSGEPCSRHYHFTLLHLSSPDRYDIISILTTKTVIRTLVSYTLP